LRAQIHQTGKSTYAGHAEIKQNQIHVPAPVENLANVFEAAGFGDVDLLEQPDNRLAQRAAKQRMVVGDQQKVRVRRAQWMMTQISIAHATGMRKYHLRILLRRVWHGLQPHRCTMVHDLPTLRLGLQFGHNKVGIIAAGITEFVEIDRC